MKSETKINLNPDQKAICLKSLKDLFLATKQLHDWVLEDNLTVEMSGILPSLIENHFSDIAKHLDYQSVLAKEKEERHQQIRKANGRIRVLERQLGEGKPIDGLKEQLQVLADTVSKWWDEFGFRHIQDEKFSEYGTYSGRFCFMMDHFSSYSDTPVTDQKAIKSRLQQRVDEGYDIVFDKNGRNPQLLDNDNNRKRLASLITSRFPSALIVRTRNFHAEESGIFTFRDIEVYIYELRDIPKTEITEAGEVPNEN